MSAALTVQNNDLISFDSAKLALIKNTVARGLTDNEFEFFISVARARGLDPILNQIHAVVRGTGDKAKMTIQVAIDGFRLIAARTGDFAGIDAPKFKYDAEGNPTRCQITVYRMVQGQRCAFVAEAKWCEFVPEGNQAFMWQKMKEVMLAKVTEAQALRKAFPADLSGLYEDAELHQADATSSTRDVTPPPPTEPKQAIPKAEPKEASRPAQVAQTKTVEARAPNRDPQTHVSAGDRKISKAKSEWEGRTIRDVVDEIGLPKFMHDVRWWSEQSGRKNWREIKDLRADADDFELELHANHVDKEQLQDFKSKLTEDDLNFDAYPGELPKEVRDADAKAIFKKAGR